MNQRAIAMIAPGVLTTAYGAAIRDPDDLNKDNAFAFDDYDLWFGNDFDYYLENLLDDLLSEIESVITSEISTNQSEAYS